MCTSAPPARRSRRRAASAWSPARGNTESELSLCTPKHRPTPQNTAPHPTALPGPGATRVTAASKEIPGSAGKYPTSKEIPCVVRKYPMWQGNTPHGTAWPLSGHPRGLGDISVVPRTLQWRAGWRRGGTRGFPAWQRVPGMWHSWGNWSAGREHPARGCKGQWCAKSSPAGLALRQACDRMLSKHFHKG